MRTYDISIAKYQFVYRDSNNEERLIKIPMEILAINRPSILFPINLESNNSKPLRPIEITIEFTQDSMPVIDGKIIYSRKDIISLSSLIAEMDKILESIISKCSDEDEKTQIRIEFGFYSILYLIRENNANIDEYQYASFFKIFFSRILKRFCYTKAKEEFFLSHIEECIQYNLANHEFDKKVEIIHNDVNELKAKWDEEIQKQSNLEAQLKVLMEKTQKQLEQRKINIGTIAKSAHRINNHREEDQAERRNLRMISDLMFAIDDLNRALKSRK